MRKSEGRRKVRERRGARPSKRAVDVFRCAQLSERVRRRYVSCRVLACLRIYGHRAGRVCCCDFSEQNKSALFLRSKYCILVCYVKKKTNRVAQLSFGTRRFPSIGFFYLYRTTVGTQYLSLFETRVIRISRQKKITPQLCWMQKFNPNYFVL